MAVCRFKTAWAGSVEQSKFISPREMNITYQCKSKSHNKPQHLAFSIPITCFEDRDNSRLALHLQSFSVSVSRRNNWFPTLLFIYALFPSQCFFSQSHNRIIPVTLLNDINFKYLDGDTLSFIQGLINLKSIECLSQ